MGPTEEISKRKKTQLSRKHIITLPGPTRATTSSAAARRSHSTVTFATEASLLRHISCTTSGYIPGSVHLCVSCVARASATPTPCRTTSGPTATRGRTSVPIA
ncbi:hypothetical protein B566_EDAN017022 [Ephemera danica]|nr:hypothetical protein B566_EDAN017022 [Ephemera danica]